MKLNDEKKKRRHNEVNPKSWTKNFWENDKILRFRNEAKSDKTS